MAKVGGRVGDTFVAAPGRFLVHVTAPEGYMNAMQKSEVHVSVGAPIIDDADGGDDLAMGASYRGQLPGAAWW